MKHIRVALASLIALVALVGLAPADLAVAKTRHDTTAPAVDLTTLTGTIPKTAVLDAFDGLGSRIDDVRFRRTVEESWTVTCLPSDSDPSPKEDYVLTGTVYASVDVVRKPNGKVESFTLTGMDGVETFTLTGPAGERDFDGTEITQLTECAKGDPVSDVSPWPNYQHSWLVAEYDGVDSAVLAANF
jgi:hypothetical protein